MAWDFIKKIVGNKEGQGKNAPVVPAVSKPAAAPAPVAAKPAPAPAKPAAPAAKPAAAAKKAPAAKKTEAAPKAAAAKTPAEKTDAELAAELDAISPQILAQAKAPGQKELIISIYRKMLVAGIDINDDKEVRKWMQKHPEVLQGGETIKIETVRRDAPKVGRNDPCPCGSGKKYKKCCGAGK